MKINKHITVLIKPTHFCNLNCEYCYESEARNYHKSTLMPLEYFEKLLYILKKSYTNVNLTWHGGEPLTVSDEWYEKAYKIINKYQDSDFKIECSMQSNGVLFEKKIDLIKKFDIKCSISYDYFNDNKLRKANSNLLDTIKKYDIPTISVCDQSIINNKNILIETYENIKKSNIKSASFNIIFNNPEFNDINKLNLYIKGWKEYLTYVYYDTNSNNFNERISLNFFKNVLGYKSILCNHKECLKTFLSLDVNGEIFHCDRFWKPEMSFGNIMDMDNIVDIFTSENYKKFYNNHIKIKKECLNTCEVYSFCNGGCIADRLFFNDGSCELNPIQCKIYKELLTHCFNLIKNIKNNEIEILNPKIYELLIDKGYIPLNQCIEMEVTRNI